MKAIAAMDPNRVIGNKGQIPWHIPNDFKWFKEFTMGKTLVMGKNTFLTLPPLRGRKICVLTNDLSIGFDQDAIRKCDGLYVRRPLTQGGIVDKFDPVDWPDAVVCGGAQTYTLLLPHIDELYMTHVVDEYEGDTYMPDFEHLLPNSSVVREDKNFWVVKYGT